VKAFLSHSSADAALALDLCARLEANGVPCFIAPRDLAPGRPYPEECVRGIEACDAFVLVATSAAVHSVQVLSEIEQAHKRRKMILTVMVGRPRIGAELDFYISRLHWIELSAGAASLDDVAARLRAALAGERAWADVSKPPSLMRRMTSRTGLAPAAITAAAVSAAVILSAGALAFRSVEGTLDRDYRRLGFVTAAQSAAAVSNGENEVRLQVWLLSPGIAFGDAVLSGSARDATGRVNTVRFTGAGARDQVGGMQDVLMAVPAAADRVSICLVVPSRSLGKKYRVMQDYALAPDAARGSDRSVSALGDPVVAIEDGRPCGPRAAQ
jgi:hypothetical protein